MSKTVDPVSLPLAVTMGEPAGIGGEILLKAWADRDASGLPPFVAIDDPARLEKIAKKLGLVVPLTLVGSGAEAVRAFSAALPVAELDEPLAPPAVPGTTNVAHGETVISSIEVATQWVFEGQASAVVTNPIQKQSLYEAGFRYPGHTEYLAALTGAEGAPVMMLVSPQMRVVPVTIHIPLAEVAQQLTTQAIIHAGRVTAQSLRDDFHIRSPRLAVAGLNPHAGEGGTIGTEEDTIIGPAIEALKSEGIRVSGPFPADTLFHARARENADAFLCMYHDQALIPLKTLDFDRGVNMTLGLPLVRTSPDHGTALDIAGSGSANPESFIEALKLAASCATNRGRQTQ
ncbi:4-hydroxythreonine-4-phosphate dehydrogenase [Candidatus Phaeomarinobacter ectocarpi]|uniref:4-hydroxythreonine-4-phosphate dehydrogenase n=1 Tax=Candidatus Phaeomarinibacter ectocarpi TaxID=1458461 RepID=X5MP41_9HYPH|nr:4-hydroxythreonine-4-phosphate dehydrogenase PdxA [Candidatus Phaeomarinobacter ectocarpi]CDO60881.1 4-hydroxythreonine-4-phosphate dehydrogenase [Candidatus Phaeomarinobacter ectocarpi]